jgi:hypothetical protein
MQPIQKQCGGAVRVCIHPEVHLIGSTQHPLPLVQGLRLWLCLVGLEKRGEMVEDAVDANGPEPDVWCEQEEQEAG